MNDESNNTTLTNLELLRRHLEDGSLAAKLVDAYQTSKSEERAEVLTGIAEAHLTEIRTLLYAKDDDKD